MKRIIKNIAQMLLFLLSSFLLVWGYETNVRLNKERGIIRDEDDGQGRYFWETIIEKEYPEEASGTQ